jgi:hypothetical protein
LHANLDNAGHLLRRHVLARPFRQYRGLDMSIEIEVRMRIPSLTVRAFGQDDRRIDNREVRFRKRMGVSAVPKRGDPLDVTAAGGPPFACTVTRSGWDEEKNLFVVSCTYARRSISGSDYADLVTDSAWVSVPLVPSVMTT